jgi:hypothetical protein
MTACVAPSHVHRTRAPASTGTVGALSRVAALLALAGGVIHLAVIRHHLDEAAVTAGLALIGGAQLLVAAGLTTAPSRRVRGAGVLVHTSVVATWLVSRSVGLVVVPGAEDPVAFGVSDTIANLLGAGVIAALAVAFHLERRPTDFAVTARVARRATILVAIVAVGLTVRAVLAPHNHSGHGPVDVGEVPADPDHAPSGGRDHTHDHG